MPRCLLLSLAAVAGSVFFALPLRAESQSMLQRDKTLERAIRYEAGADKMITPRRVWKALFSKKSVEEMPDYYTETEFLPLLDANQDNVRIVGAIAFKF